MSDGLAWIDTAGLEVHISDTLSVRQGFACPMNERPPHRHGASGQEDDRILPDCGVSPRKANIFSERCEMYERCVVKWGETYLLLEFHEVNVSHSRAL